MRHIYDFKKTIDYGAPSRRRRKNQSRFNFKEKALLVTLGLALAAWVYVFLFSPLFSIQNVRIDGLETISRDTLENMVNAMGKNIFRFNVTRTINAIKAAYFLEDVHIAKVYPQGIIIAIAEKHPAFELAMSNHRYLLDTNGLVIEAAVTSSTMRRNGALPLIAEADDRELAIRDRAIDQKKIAAIAFFIKGLSDEDQLSINMTTVDPGEPDLLTFKTSEGFDVMVSSKEDLNTELFNLTAFLKGQGEARKKLLYVNERFVERIYFKFKP